MKEEKNIALITARKAKGWTQEDLAQQLNCRKSTISNWENHVSQPTLEVAIRVSELLGENVNTLFSRPKVQDSQTMTA